MLATIIILTIADVGSHREGRLSQLSSQLVVHVRSAGVDGALSSGTCDKKTELVSKGLPGPTTEPVAQSANREFPT